MMNSKQGTMGNALGAGRRAPSEEVSVGYKRTEVGVIPEEWRASTIGAEFRVQLGKMLDAAKERWSTETVHRQSLCSMGTD